MRTVIATVWIAAAIASPAAAQNGGINPALSPRNANYSIQARLEPSTRTISATETIVWRNNTAKTVDDLQFHLYWNAWRDTKSTFMREAALAGRDESRRPSNEWASVDITSIRQLGAASTDLTGRQRFIAPDDGNRDDRTVMDLPVPQPIGPGQTATVEIVWTAHVPRTFDRTGAIGNYFFIAQWFPKLGVLQDTGWNSHQFHASTEFFSDYGVYDVRLTVPAGWVVGATGVERERRDNADRTTTHRYYQEDVHDFAWTTSPDFVERTARFEHAPLPPVDMRLLLQPEHAGQADRHFDGARTTLRYYGEWYGAYPYGHITIVDPAYNSQTGGMEYPTLFTAGTRWLAPRGVLTPEDVTVHEAGHQWWYGIVGSNEFEDAWMDEGFNSFSEARAISAAFQPNYLGLRYFGGFVPFVLRDFVLDRDTYWNRLRTYRANPKSDEQSTPSYRYFPTAAGAVTYAKTALWMATLEKRIGWPLLQRIMSTYFERWKFKHPRPDDFFDTVTNVAGRDLGWFFDQTYRSSNVFDYGVQDVRSTDERNGVFRTTVVVRRYGEAIFPVDVRVTFASGEQVIEHWTGRDRWKAFAYERGARARSAEVDPDHVLLLDVNATNNSKTLASRADAAATKWSTKWMVWLQDCLLSWAALV